MPSMRYRGPPASRLISLLVLVLASCHVVVVDSSIPRSGTASRPPLHSIPDDDDDDDDDASSASHRPPWNTSPQINEQGYLHELFRRVPGEWEADFRPRVVVTRPAVASDDDVMTLDVPVCVRQVPGDGDCLFHAVAISLNLVQGGRHLRMDCARSLRELKEMSRRLRRTAVGCLRSSCNSNRGDTRHSSGKSSVFPTPELHGSGRPSRRFKRLFVQGSESMPTSELLSTAASQYGISSEEYCDLMEQDSYWGGGPEIVALCNVLKRPIHVYELVPATREGGCESSGGDEDGQTQERGGTPSYVNGRFRLRRMAAFGSPRYDSRAPLHILSADSRFPDVEPHCIAENGNHFMAIFPVDAMRPWANATAETEGCGRKAFDSDRKRRVRGGAANDIGDAVSDGTVAEEAEEAWLFHGEWYDGLRYSSPPRDEDKERWICGDRPYPSGRSGWQNRNVFHPLRKERGLAKGKEEVSRQSMKRIVGFWIDVLVWTLSHFHIGF